MLGRKFPWEDTFSTRLFFSSFLATSLCVSSPFFFFSFVSIEENRIIEVNVELLTGSAFLGFSVFYHSHVGAGVGGPEGRCVCFVRYWREACLKIDMVESGELGRVKEVRNGYAVSLKGLRRGSRVAGLRIGTCGFWGLEIVNWFFFAMFHVPCFHASARQGPVQV